MEDITDSDYNNGKRVGKHFEISCCIMFLETLEKRVKKFMN